MPKQDKTEPDTKAEAERRTGPDPHPGNVSDFSDLVPHQPLRAERLRGQEGTGKLVESPTEPADGEKIGRIPGEVTRVKATNTYLYQVVVTPVGPGGEVLPGPDNAAITSCIAAGWRPVGESKITEVENHPDGVSKIVTWSIPCVEASAPEYRDEA